MLNATDRIEALEAEVQQLRARVALSEEVIVRLTALLESKTKDQANDQRQQRRPAPHPTGA